MSPTTHTNKWLLLLIPILDIAFILSFGFLYQLIFLSASDTMQSINGLVQQESQLLFENKTTAAMQIHDQLLDAALQAVYVLVGILVSLIGSWTLFQGLVWFIIAKVGGSVISWKRFFGRFILINFLLFVLLAIIIAATAYLFTNVVEETALQSLQTKITALLQGFLILIVFFLFWSYAIIGTHHPLKTTLSSLPKSLWLAFAPYLVFCCTAASLGLLSLYATAYPFWITFCIVFFVILPANAATRYWLSRWVLDTIGL